MLNRHAQTNRPLARTLAIGVPWLAVVTLLAGAEYVRNEGTLTRGLLELFSGSCPSQVAGVELPECSELEAPGSDFAFEADREWLVFAPGQLHRMGTLEGVSGVPVHLMPPARTVPVEHSQQGLIALEAARAEMDHAMEAASAEVNHAMAVARSWREVQESRSSTSYLLRRSVTPRPDAEPPAVSVRVSTDG